MTTIVLKVESAIETDIDKNVKSFTTSCIFAHIRIRSTELEEDERLGAIGS